MTKKPAAPLPVRGLVFTVARGQTTFTLEYEKTAVMRRGKPSFNLKWLLNGRPSSRYWGAGVDPLSEADKKMLTSWCEEGEKHRIAILESNGRDVDFRERTGIKDTRFELNSGGDIYVELSLSLTESEAVRLYGFLKQLGKARDT